MIVELGVPAWLVALMVALPLVFAPFRALIGFKSDTHRSVLGWRRVPYIWIGTLLQFGGLAIMPFALLVLSGDTHGPAWIGQAAAALAFLLVGAGMHTTQTAGLALATDLAPRDVAAARGRAAVRDAAGRHGRAARWSSACCSSDFSADPPDPGDPGRGAADAGPQLRRAVEAGSARSGARRTGAGRDDPLPRALGASSPRRPQRAASWWPSGLGTAAFSMQDVLLEPYGGEILHLAVGRDHDAHGVPWRSAALARVRAGGAPARPRRRSVSPRRVRRCWSGIVAFAAVIFAAPLDSALLFRTGALLIGFGGGLFAVGTLTARDGRSSAATTAAWRSAPGAPCRRPRPARHRARRRACATRRRAGRRRARSAPRSPAPSPATAFVYHIEIALAVRDAGRDRPAGARTAAVRAGRPSPFGLAEFPG